MTKPHTRYIGMDIWYAWTQDMGAAYDIFVKLNPFEAKRILLQAACIGNRRLPINQQPGYYSWLGSLAEIVWEKGNHADCYLAGIKYLRKAKSGQWLEEIAKWRAGLLVE